MKISFSWLKHYLETELTAQEIADKLTALGLVVDEVVDRGIGLGAFKIAEVTAVDAHPNADRLKVCTVSHGAGTPPVTVVCGAPNVTAGMKTILAQPGDRIPASGFVLKDTEIRGVASHGMLCSYAELGLSEESEGIAQLPQDAPVGLAYARYAGLDDPVFDIDLTPNRADCFSVYGLARDLHAAGCGVLRSRGLAKGAAYQDHQKAVEKVANVHIDTVAQEACPVFYARHLDGVRNGASPSWMQSYLQAAGLRPKSALVDIVNYVMVTHGHPMHVFDTARLEGDLQVRFAQAGETLEALDEKTYALDPSMLVVADQKGPVSLAGIMGGAASGASQDTNSIILEAALFAPNIIAKTGRLLGLVSDSRTRFERGVDPHAIQICMDEATRLILRYCGGSVAATWCAGSVVAPTVQIPFDPAQVRTRGAVALAPRDCEDYLKRLGCDVCVDAIPWTVCVPSWRHDLKISEDLVEEVCRLVGYDRIAAAPLPPLPVNTAARASADSEHELSHRMRRLLSARGLNEAYTWSFLSQDMAVTFGGGASSMVLANPLSQELSTMRPTLVANLVLAVQERRDKGYTDHGMYEVGVAFSPDSSMGQTARIAGARAGMRRRRSWRQDARPVDVFDAKADLYAVLRGLGVPVASLSVKATGPSWMHPGRVGSVFLGPKTCLGVFGEIHPGVLDKVGGGEPMVSFECYRDAIPRKMLLQASGPNKPAFTESSLMPLYRDMAFILDRSVAAQDILAHARRADPQNVIDADIFDVYAGDKIAPNKKSVGIWIQIKQTDTSLTDAEIHAVMDAVIARITAQTGATLRSS